mmetsp:Transcript_17762/g.26802  ORF Transcript_17762/g.26802 Transcript_17762/m.26802 type:complete len:586 (-) Transcript_17762:194-1951(-)
MDLLKDYGSDTSETEENAAPKLEAKVLTMPKSAAPIVPLGVAAKVGGIGTGTAIVPFKTNSQLIVNPKAAKLGAAAEGPAHPYKEEMYVPATGKKVHTGVLEKAQLEEWAFSEQYHTFHQFGWAQDSQGQLVGDEQKFTNGQGETIFTKSDKQLRRELKAERKRKAEEIAEGKAEAKARGELYESLQSDFERGALTEEQRKFRETFEAERKAKYREYDMEEDHDRRDERKRGHLLPPRHNRDTQAPEATSVFHGQGERDYQGRSWLAPPKGARPGGGDHKAFPPKRCVHKWTGHTKGVNHVEWLPGYGHLLLSCSMDSKVKIWDAHGQRQVKRTYSGHSMGVREARFNSTGAQFVTVSFDRFARVWDTETGQAVSTFTNRKVPYCATFYPEDENIFLAGCSDNQVVQWDMRTGEIVQLYNHHLGPVNTVTFVEENRRIVTTSDDKKILVWEYNIPVPITYISEPHMHSMPAVTVHPRGQYFAGQSLNNEIHVYTAAGRFKQMRKKVFKGHVNAGYANRITFSPNGKYMASGDAEGKFFVWDWGSTRIYKRLNAHENGPCISAAWHPVEPSWVATCGWDGLIKLWD